MSPFRLKIAFVSDENSHHGIIFVLLIYLLHPCLDIYETLEVIVAKDNYHSSRSLVISRCEDSVFWHACSVPYLKFQYCLINVNCLYLEVYADCWTVCIQEGLSSYSPSNLRLSYLFIPN